MRNQDNSGNGPRAKQAVRGTFRNGIFPVLVQLVLPSMSRAASVFAIFGEEILEVCRPLSHHSSVYQAEHRDVAPQT